MPSIYIDTDEQLIVSYPVKEHQQRISKATYFAIRAIPNKVNAIKFIRMVHGTGLLESKLIVETIMECSNALTAPFDKDIQKYGFDNLRGIPAETIN